MNQKTKRKLIFGGMVFFVLAVFIYGLIQSRDYLLGTKIEIFEPQDKAVLTDRFVEIKGKIERASFVSLNNRPIYLNENGLFAEEITLKKGYNMIEIWVKDRFNREKIKKLELIYKEKNE